MADWKDAVMHLFEKKWSQNYKRKILITPAK